jgi:hypothetical protein
MIKKIGLVSILLFAINSMAASVPASFTYQGIVMNSAGTAPLTSVVSLKLSIYDPTGNCLLYQEQQANIDLSQTNGTFAVQVGSATGAVKRTISDQGLAMPSIFANNGQILAASTSNCTAGYTPTSADGRLLRVAVTNGGSTVTISPDLQINSVPNSMVAETLQGYSLAQVRAAPNRTILTTGSGTYTVPAGTSYLEIRMIGGGGGGSGVGNGATGGIGGTGGTTTFGTSLLTATGGQGGVQFGAGSAGSGGSVTVNSPALQMVAIAGSLGFQGSTTTTGSNGTGGSGGSGPFGGSGSGGPNTAQGSSATNNTGAGGGGAGSIAAGLAGCGGGSGGYIEAVITNPLSTYTYSVGTGGTAGAAGTSGVVGGAGGSGILMITAH